MMDKYWVVAIVVVFCIFLVIYTQRAHVSPSKMSFKEKLCRKSLVSIRWLKEAKALWFVKSVKVISQMNCF